MSGVPLPPTFPGDAASRAAIASDPSRRSVVVAGAGSGKTTCLVERVATLLAGGATHPEQIAVITFTEKAARELVHRLRERGIGGVDRAYVGTIHGFCRQILARYPIEAGLPPVFSVVDEITSETIAGERKTAAVNALYDRAAADRALEDALAVVAERGQLKALPELAGLIDAQWDRFVVADLRVPTDEDARREIDNAVDPIRTLVQRARAGELPASVADRLEGPIAGWLDRVGDTSISDLALDRVQAVTLGAAGGPAWRERRDLAKRAVGSPQEIAADAVVRRVLGRLVPLVLDAAAARLAAGELNFDDLLVLSRRLLRDCAAVRAELRSEITHVFVDEFQDTDPVQFELVRLLCDHREGEPGGAVLFAVGDPKQAIYSFRNADVALFNELVAQAARSDGYFELTANFRTRRSLASWVNETMRARFGGAGETVQAPYHDLAPVRLDLDDDPGPAVSVLGMEADGGCVAVTSAHEASLHEVADLVSTISDAVGSWLVGPSGASPGEPARPARYGDIAVLIRSRTGLAMLEQGLREARIPYRIEGGTLVYESREVYEILRLLRAIADPASDAAVVAALRTSLFGITDIDLFEHRHAPDRLRSWRLPHGDALVDDQRPGPARVHAALRTIRGWADEAYHRSPASLIGEIYDRCLGSAVAAFEGAQVEAELRRRVRFVIDEARAWSDTTGGTLAEYLAWVATRVDGVERTEIATDEGEDSVRIMTVHAAKGLQFPIVAVVGLGRRPPVESGVYARWVGDRPEVNILSDLRTSGVRNEDSQTYARAEEARLLYVAMTRAEDHLVVSVWRGRRSGDSAAQRLVAHLAGAADRREPAGVGLAATDGPDLTSVLRPSSGHELPRLARPPVGARSVWTPSGLSRRDDPAPPEPEPERERDIDDDSLDRRYAPVDPGERDPGKDKDPPSGVDRPRSRGRYGSEVGIAVHEVLQFVSLRDPHDGLDDLIAASCAAADVAPEHHRTVREHVLTLIDSDVFEELRASGDVRREVYVGTTTELDGEPVTLWGYVDAIYRAADGRLVVVDYKTDSSGASAADLQARYRIQMEAYRTAVERITGETDVRAVLAISTSASQVSHSA